MIYVVGHPRCGTGYMARLLTAFGYHVGHEVVRQDGMSAWSWAVVDKAAPWCWAPGRKPRPRTRLDFNGAHVIHVIRNPERAVWSIAYAHDDDATKAIIEKYTIQLPGQSKLDNAALSFLCWNKLIAAQGPDLVVQVEQAPDVLSRYFGRALPKDLPPTNYNTRPKQNPPPYYGEPLGAHLHGPVYAALEKWCADYGYELRGREEVAS